MHSAQLIAVRPSRVLPASIITSRHYQPVQRRFRRRYLISSAVTISLLSVSLWAYMGHLRPPSQSESNHLAALLPTLPSLAPRSLEPPATQAEPEPEPTIIAQPAPKPARTWAPIRREQERLASDHLPVDDWHPVRVRVVTISAKITAYTPWDHSVSKPEWADGLVAWYPDGRKRRVRAHPYGFATDWNQFPGGATFIRVPGYMNQSFPRFPENFRVVDDKCGQSRKARRRGRQPIIDARFLTRYSAIAGPNAWGSKQLEVEVVYPADFSLPRSLRRWVVKCEWHTYQHGELIERKPAPLP